MPSGTMANAVSLMLHCRAKGEAAVIGDMSFIRPIKVGSVVCCYTHLISMGRSSARIMVEVWSRMPEDELRHKVTEAEFVYVAIDDNRRIRPIEPRISRADTPD